MVLAEPPKHEPRFSVVLPTYNRAHVVMRAIDSVLVQTFPDFELIVVDDESTDGSWNLLTKIGDERVRVVRNVRSKGVSGARNTGIDLASGAWICAIDSDDRWDVDFLRLLEEGVSRAGLEVGIVYGSVTFVEDGRLVHVKTAETSGMTYPRMLHEHFFYHTASAFRTSLLRELGGYDEALSDREDSDLQLRLTERCELLPVPGAMYYYHRSGGNDRLTQNHAEAARCKRYFLEKHADLFAKYPATRFSVTFKGMAAAIRGGLWGLAGSMWLKLLPAAWRRPRAYLRYQLEAAALGWSRILRRR